MLLATKNRLERLEHEVLRLSALHVADNEALIAMQRQMMTIIDALVAMQAAIFALGLVLDQNQQDEEGDAPVPTIKH